MLHADQNSDVICLDHIWSAEQLNKKEIGLKQKIRGGHFVSQCEHSLSLI